MSREQEAFELRRRAEDVLAFANVYGQLLGASLEAQLARTGDAMLILANALTLRPTRFHAKGR